MTTEQTNQQTIHTKPYTFGYARVSSDEQNEARQIELLQSAGCDEIVIEKISGAKIERPKLDLLMSKVREGDKLIVTSIDRLGRDTKHLLSLLDILKGKKVLFEVLDLNIDTNSIYGSLIFNIIASLAEAFNRLRDEAQQAGIKLAKTRGVYKKREYLPHPKTKECLELLHKGLNKSQIAKYLQISRTTVIKIINAHKKMKL